MPGGLLQLEKYGNVDFILTGNPSISFFKAVYRKYSNFTIESIALEFDKTDLSFDSTTTFKRVIPRDADLMSQVFVSFTLPEIQSEPGRDFHWIKNIGTTIIQEISIFVGGREIDKHYGEWLNIWNELTLPKEKEDTYNQMIGNIPEIYAPEESYENNGAYPDATVGIDFLPSIRSYRIYVPLAFWFCRHPGLALPLIALQYHHVEVEMILRPIKDLYTIIETDASQENFGYRVKPDPSISAHLIANFLSNNDLAATNSDGSRSLIKFDINPELEVFYIFLDKEERKRFAAVEHEYLIERTFRVEKSGLAGGTTKSLELLINHPVKQLVWVGKRSDIEDRNDWNNYTNWIIEGISPYSFTYINPYGATVNITSTNYVHYKDEHIIESAKLLLNGYERFKEKDDRYFNLVQPFNYNYRPPKTGINVYSFALNNSVNINTMQPSGGCNMSNFNKVELWVKLHSISSEESYLYDINIYAVSHNIFRILGGMGNLEFSP